MNGKSVLFLICMMLLIPSCTKQKSQNFPNPMSEMAIAMRDMTEKLQEVKTNLNEENIPTLNFPTFSSLEMTDDSFDKPGFPQMAQQFIQLSEKFDSQPTIQHYNDVVYMCQSCHNYLCPGPLERIKKLEYPINGNSN